MEKRLELAFPQEVLMVQPDDDSELDHVNASTDSAPEQAASDTKPPAKTPWPRRRILYYGATATAGLAIGAYAGAAAQRWLGQGDIPPALTPHGVLDDASRLNPTPVRGVVYAGSSGETTRDLLGPLLGRIRRGEDPPLAVCGVRHSMGGQSMLRDGWVLDMQRLNGIALDSQSRVVRVGAGATWRDIIPVLNAAGLAPTVMQSNHDFTVGGSLSVNCHGWHTNSQPIASTVRRLRVLTAGGEILTCSPQENEELFRHALGGYGLFCVVLEADLAVVPNVLLTPVFTTVSTSDYARTFAERVYAKDSPVEMAYGRLSVDPDNLLEDAIIVTFSGVPGTRGAVLPLTTELDPELARAIYRNSVDSDTGKALRWWLERKAGPWLADEASRNSLLNEPVAVFANNTEDTTDILHEYFVPQEKLWDFARQAKEIIARAAGNLLNVTVRDVRRDARSVLAYARQDVFGLVMSFVQTRSADGEQRMQAMTRALIDAAIAAGGSFYLPYRLHATTEQLRRAYPAWDSAMQAKSRYDPGGIFDNGLYQAYGKA
jgi:FAD/FMN-containing dehydrogenase